MSLVRGSGGGAGRTDPEATLVGCSPALRQTPACPPTGSGDLVGGEAGCLVGAAGATTVHRRAGRLHLAILPGRQSALLCRWPMVGMETAA